MSLLLIGATGRIGQAVTSRLLEQGDEVRMVAGEEARDWPAGVHVARGPELDADLIERAGQNCRTVVAIGDVPMMEVVAGARRAGIPRIVGYDLPPAERATLIESGIDYVVIAGGKGLLRKGPAPEVIAEAIDAADDIAGEPRLEIELSDPEGRAKLGLH